jgi:cobalt/nickel transport system permease protein
LAALIVLKAVAVLTLVLVAWATAPWEVTLKALHALRVPGLLVQLLALTYRYLFLLGEEVVRLRTALRVRGYRNRANLHSYRTVGHVAGTLLVRSHERAERVGQAMRCRGFDGRFRALVDFRTRARDVLAFALIVGTAAGLLAWDLLRR